MTEFEKELVRFVSGYLDAGVSAEDYVKAFSKRLLDSIGRQSKPKACEGLEEEIDRIVKCEKEFMNFKFKSQLIGYIARHFAQWGAEHAREQRKPKPSEELETEALRSAGVLLSEHFEDEDDDAIRTTALRCWKGGVIHGASWQKEKDERIYRDFYNERNQGDASFRDILAYKEGHRDGMEEQREQMMKEAVEGWIARDKDGRLDFFYKKPPIRGNKEWLPNGAGMISSVTFQPLFPNLKWEDEPIKVRIIIVKED